MTSCQDISRYGVFPGTVIKILQIIRSCSRFRTLGIEAVHAPLLHFEYPVVSRFIHNEWGQAIVLLLLTLTICIAATPIFLKLIPQAVAQKDFIKTKQSQQQES